MATGGADSRTASWLTAVHSGAPFPAGAPTQLSLATHASSTSDPPSTRGEGDGEGGEGEEGGDDVESAPPGGLTAADEAADGSTWPPGSGAVLSHASSSEASARSTLAADPAIQADASAWKSSRGAARGA